MKLKDLKKIAEEINDLFDLDPPIGTEETEQVMVELLVKAFGMLKKDDDKDDYQTHALIQQLANEFPDDLDKKALKGLAFIDIVPEEKEKEDKEPETTDEDGIETVTELTLAEEVEGAERLKDLKDIAKANDEFKDLRGQLSKYKTADDLREAMEEVLDDEAPESTLTAEEIAEAEKAAKKKAKKEKKAKEKSEAELSSTKEKPEKEPKAEKEPKQKKDKDEGTRTIFGHRIGSQSGKIDEQFSGKIGKKVLLSTIVENTGLSAGRIKSHIAHLIKKKKLNIDIKKADKDTSYKYTK